jgi:hypothetical protein
MEAIQSTTVMPLSPAELDALLRVRDGDTVADISARVERALGLDRAIPMPALHRMMSDEEYFHDLIATRSAPAMLWHLLETANEEAAIAAEGTSGVGHDGEATAPSTPELLAMAAHAFAAWSKGGFTQVEEAQRERRIVACLSCDKLSAPPQGFLYKIAGLVAADNRTCKACGCYVSAKSRLPQENCPVPMAEGSDISRWGEPLRRT